MISSLTPPLQGAGKSVPSSVKPLQVHFAIVLHLREVSGHRHREIIKEIQHLTRNAVPLDMEVVAADAQINGRFVLVHTLVIGSTAVSLKVSRIRD